MSRGARTPFRRGFWRGLAREVPGAWRGWVGTFLQQLSALLCELVGGREKFDAGSDVVDQGLDLFGDVVGVAGGHHATRAAVLVFVVFGVQKIFDFAG